MTLILPLKQYEYSFIWSVSGLLTNLYCKRFSNHWKKVLKSIIYSLKEEKNLNAKCLLKTREGIKKEAEEDKKETKNKKKQSRTFLVVQWLRLCASNAEDAGLIPGWGRCRFDPWLAYPTCIWGSQKSKTNKQKRWGDNAVINMLNIIYYISNDSVCQCSK